MLNLDKLLYKLIYAIGAEPIIATSSTATLYSAGSRLGGRVALGTTTDDACMWTVTAMGDTSSNIQYYLVEVYYQFNAKYPDNIPSTATSGGFYRSYFDQTTDSHTQHPRVWTLTTANLSDLIDIGGTQTLLCRVGFGSATTYANTTSTSHMHSDITIDNDFTTLRFQAHRVGGNITSSLNTFTYTVSLWQVSNPDYYI